MALSVPLDCSVSGAESAGPIRREQEQLPTEVQAEIAMRVGNLIELAKPVGDALLQRFAEVARQEQLLAVREGAKRDTDPLWAAPAHLRGMV